MHACMQEHLDRSLPAWAPLIDCWIVGVDDKNTDNSEEIIYKHLGHIPGTTVVVSFDGMGPTWTELVLKGLELYPNCTHGIISDADFTPTTKHLDKRQLKRECSKHMYQIRSFDGGTVRNMDWIYRNIPGAKVERRTHQSVTVPPIPGQRVFQTMIDLEVQEYSGGYQDRTGKKSETYLKWLHKDLEEMPGDPRTIYYLGHAHVDMIGPNARADVMADPPGPGAEHVRKALEFFKWRADIRFGYHEERWFALLKAGEICERYLADYQCSTSMWSKAHRLDSERVDALFYLGQHFRLAQAPLKSIPYLVDAVKLKYPARSLFNWDYMYACLRHVELGRAVVAALASGLEVDSKDLKTTKKALKLGAQNCAGERPEVDTLLASVAKALRDAKAKKVKASEAAEVRPKAKEHVAHELDGQADSASKPAASSSPLPPAPAPMDSRPKKARDISSPAAILDVLQPFTIWQGVYESQIETLLLSRDSPVSAETRDIMPKMVRLIDLIDSPQPSCSVYRPVAHEYLDSFRSGLGELRDAFRDEHPQLWADWLENNMRLWGLCQSAS